MNIVHKGCLTVLLSLSYVDQKAQAELLCVCVCTVVQVSDTLISILPQMTQISENRANYLQLCKQREQNKYNPSRH